MVHSGRHLTFITLLGLLLLGCDRASELPVLVKGTPFCASIEVFGNGEPVIRPRMGPPRWKSVVASGERVRWCVCPVRRSWPAGARKTNTVQAGKGISTVHWAFPRKKVGGLCVLVGGAWFIQSGWRRTPTGKPQRSGMLTETPGLPILRTENSLNRSGENVKSHSFLSLIIAAMSIAYGVGMIVGVQPGSAPDAVPSVPPVVVAEPAVAPAPAAPAPAAPEKKVEPPKPEVAKVAPKVVAPPTKAAPVVAGLPTEPGMPPEDGKPIPNAPGYVLPEAPKTWLPSRREERKTRWSQSLSRRTFSVRFANEW